MFGDAKAGGTVNVSTKRALSHRRYQLSTRFTNQGGRRVTLDVNQPITKKLAVRVNGLLERSDGWQDYSRLDRDGVFGTISWTPTKTFQLRVDAEYGKIDRRSPASYLTDQTSNWNGAYYLTSRLTGSTNPSSAFGATRFDNSSANRNRNYHILNLGNESLGFVDWQGHVRSSGLNTPLETKVPDGISLDAVPVGEQAVFGQRAYRVTPDYEYSANISGYRNETDYTAYTVSAEKRIGRNLFLELAGVIQNQDSLSQTPASHNRVYLDLNQNLPNGVLINGSNVNPNFLKPYVMGTGLRFNQTDTDVAEVRASAVYQLDTTITKQKIGAVFSYRRHETKTIYPWIVRVNGSNPDLAAIENRLYFQAYLHDARGLSLEKYGLKGDHVFPNDIIGRYEVWNGSGGGNTSDLDLYSAQIFANGTWFRNELVSTMIGIRRDKVKLAKHTATFDSITNRLNGFAFQESVDEEVNSPSAGAVIQITKSIGIYGNYSKTFYAPTGNVQDIHGGLLPLSRGRGLDFGVKFSLFNRIHGSIGYYDSREENTAIRVSTLTDAVNSICVDMGVPGAGATSPLTRDSDTQDVKATGYELDVIANITPNWSLVFNASLPDSELSNSLSRYRSFISQHRAEWEAAANDPTNPNATSIATDLSTIDADLARQADGLPRSDTVDYIINVFTRYRIARGPLKGLEFGGGANFIGKNLIALSSTDQSRTYTRGYGTFSGLVSYSRRWLDVDWRIQLNVSNIFDRSNFRYTSLNSSQLPQQWRVTAPRTYSLTLSGKF